MATIKVFVFPCLCVTFRPAAMAVISLAFGQYILEPLFMPCGIPPMAVKLATAIGFSMYSICMFLCLVSINRENISLQDQEQSHLKIKKKMFFLLS